MPNSDVAKAFKLLTFGGIVLILLGGGLLLERLTRFHSRVAQLKDQGHPVCYADLTHDVVEGKRDALPLLLEAAAAAHEFQRKLVTRHMSRRSVDERIVDQYEELSAEYPELLPRLSRAANCDDISIRISDGHVTEDDLSGVPFDTIAEIMQLRIRVLAAQGKPDDAVRAGIELLRLSRLPDQHPTSLASRFMSNLTCRQFAVYALYDVLNEHTISDEVREELHEELEKQGSMAAFSRAILGARAAVIETISRLPPQQIAVNGNAALNFFESFAELCHEPVIHLEQSKYKFTTIENWTSWFAQSVAPGYQSVLEIECRSISRVRALRIISALQAGDADQRDQWDREYLTTLGVPEPMTTDILTGDAMIVRQQDNQWLVYSVGANGIDDGGAPVADFGLPGNSRFMRMHDPVKE